MEVGTDGRSNGRVRPLRPAPDFSLALSEPAPERNSCAPAAGLLFTTRWGAAIGWPTLSPGNLDRKAMPESVVHRRQGGSRSSSPAYLASRRAPMWRSDVWQRAGGTRRRRREDLERAIHPQRLGTGHQPPGRGLPTHSYVGAILKRDG